MDIYCNGTAKVKHHRTGKIYDIDSGELDWGQDGGDERPMGLEIHYEAVLEHPELGVLTWGLWEYPVGAENYRETDVGDHELIQDVDYGLQHTEDRWGEYDIPEDTFSIFMKSYNDTCDLLKKHGEDDGGGVLNRMLFVHQITAMEAYLCDTLINKVMGDSDAQERLMTKHDKLKEKKFTLSEIAKEKKFVEAQIRKYLLDSVLYHRIKDVNNLYDVALKINILNFLEEKRSFEEAIKLRHHCIHRNGFDKDGNKLESFTKLFVQDTADMIKVFVEKIEQEILRLDFEDVWSD